jgi:C4-dicarboxylate-specific signal transduction histidine kinase
MTFSSPHATARYWSCSQALLEVTLCYGSVCWFLQALEDVRKKRKELNEEAKVRVSCILPLVEPLSAQTLVVFAQSSEAELNLLRTHQQASQEIQKEIKEREEQLTMLTDKAKEYKISVEEGERREEALKVRIVAVESRK